MSITVGGQRIPLTGQAHGLESGQPVTAEVVTQQEGLALRVLPHPPPGAGPDSPALPRAVPEILRNIMAALGHTGRTTQVAQTMPPQLPQTDAALRSLLSLFLNRTALGDDMQQVGTMLSRAAGAGMVQEAAAAFAALAEALTAADTGALRNLLQRLSRARSVEARIAAALAAGNVDDAMAELNGDLRTLLAQLRGNTAFRAWLHGRGQWKGFDEAAQRILQRLDGAALQNLHGLKHPYTFLDLPLPAETGFRRAQVHLLGDGKGKRFDRGRAVIGMDLSTTHLGDLWVTLDIAPQRCRCLFRAANIETVAAIEAQGAALAEGLEAAGYAHAIVEVTPWDGDRLREAAALLRPLAGLDVQS
ncbi:MAG: hypothetical protein ACLFTT_01775 [Candidatus Hydrogenedentota bacterium]